MRYYKLHFGPGVGWKKPSEDWLCLDVDNKRADIVINFNDFEKLPFDENSIVCIYGSHIFEHISMFNTPKVFKECFRILIPNGSLRMVLPDVRKSIEEYIKGNKEFPLFRRRAESLKKILSVDEITLFEALKGDFISPSSQPDLLGRNALAHQNAWDIESIFADLRRAGFTASKIHQMSFRKLKCPDFSFEGTYSSEANESERSIYVEAQK